MGERPLVDPDDFRGPFPRGPVHAFRCPWLETFPRWESPTKRTRMQARPPPVRAFGIRVESALIAFFRNTPNQVVGFFTGKLPRRISITAGSPWREHSR